jgi:hypothetical protein
VDLVFTAHPTQVQQCMQLAMALHLLLHLLLLWAGAGKAWVAGWAFCRALANQQASATAPPHGLPQVVFGLCASCPPRTAPPLCCRPPASRC